jgi:Ca2+-binding RTX toxin-like protein
MAGIVNGLDGNVTGNPIGIDGYSSSALNGNLLIQNNQFRDTAPFYSIMVADFNGIVSADISLSGVSSNTFTNAAASPGTRDTDILYNLTSHLVTTGSNTVSGVTYSSVIVDSTNSSTVISGTGDSNYISGQQLGDTLNGLAGNDRLSGNSGDDTLSGGSGDDLLEGGSGTDTATFSGNYADYSFSYSGTAGSYLLQVTGPDGTDTLTGIELLQFIGSTTTVRVAGFGAYASIAAALSAASSDSPDGEVILIEPGTYTGQTYSLPGHHPHRIRQQHSSLIQWSFGRYTCMAFRGGRSFFRGGCGNQPHHRFTDS